MNHQPEYQPQNVKVQNPNWRKSIVNEKFIFTGKIDIGGLVFDLWNGGLIFFGDKESCTESMKRSIRRMLADDNNFNILYEPICGVLIIDDLEEDRRFLFHAA